MRYFDRVFHGDWCNAETKRTGVDDTSNPFTGEAGIEFA